MSTIALWPPGAQKCTYTAPDGRGAEEIIVPWLAWIAGVLLAILAAAATWLVRRMGDRMILALMATSVGVFVLGYWILLISPGNDRPDPPSDEVAVKGLMNQLLISRNPSLCKYSLTDRAILELYAGSLTRCERIAANAEGLHGVASVEINSLHTQGDSGSVAVTLAPVDRASGRAGPPLRYELLKVDEAWRIAGLHPHKIDQPSGTRNSSA